MLLDVHAIQCTQRNQTDSQVRQNFVAENYEIPPKYEILIYVFLDRKYDDTTEKKKLLIRILRKFCCEVSSCYGSKLK